MNLNVIVTKLSILLSSGESENGKVVGGLVGDGLDWFVDSFKKGLVEILYWIGTGLFTILTPIVNCGSKSIIVICFIVVFCSGDKRVISKAIWTFFIFVIFFMLRGVVLR